MSQQLPNGLGNNNNNSSDTPGLAMNLNQQQQELLWRVAMNHQQQQQQQHQQQPQQLLQQQQPQQPLSNPMAATPASFSANFASQASPMAAAMLLQQQHQQQQQQQQNMLQASLNQQILGAATQQPQQLPQQPQQPATSLGDEIKRIHQLQQLGSMPSVPSNALLQLDNSSANRSTSDNNSNFLQSLIDAQAQKMVGFNPTATATATNPLAALTSGTTAAATTNAGGTGGGTSSLLHPSFLNDARLLMAQNQALQQVNPFQAAAMAAGVNDLPLPSPHSIFHRDGTRRMRGGVIEPFPEKLHRLLTEVEQAGRSDVISFVANGRAFAIHKPDAFFKEIVPLYFRQSRLSSFKRQLNLYGFELINSGPARGGYFHELFVKDNPDMCRRMRRVAVKVSGKEKEKQTAADKVTEEKGDSVAVKQEENSEGGTDPSAAATQPAPGSI